jgi:hypothetical protein
MRLGKWEDINWKRVWLIVLIVYVALILTSGWWGWHLEGYLIR